MHSNNTININSTPNNKINIDTTTNRPNSSNNVSSPHESNYNIINVNTNNFHGQSQPFINALESPSSSCNDADMWNTFTSLMR